MSSNVSCSTEQELFKLELMQFGLTKAQLSFATHPVKGWQCPLHCKGSQSNHQELKSSDLLKFRTHPMYKMGYL